MSETRKGASKAIPQTQDTNLDELRTAFHRLQEDVQRLQSGLSDHAKVKKNLDEAWKAIEQLQVYRDEDNQSLSIVVDDIAQRHEELMENLGNVHKELSNAIRSGNISTGGYVQESEENVYSLFGIEAPKETWLDVLKFIVGLAVLAGGAYVAYKHISSKKNQGGSSVAM